MNASDVQFCGASCAPTDLPDFERRGFVAEPKYDGIWCLRDSVDRLWSRHGKQKAYALPKLRVPCVLVGELAYGSQSASQTVRAVGHNLFWAFDMLEREGQDMRGMRWWQRHAELEALLAECGSPREYPAPPLVEQNIETFYREFVSRGGEGVVLKDPAMPYHGGRAADWVKCKRQDTVERLFMGVEESTSSSYAGSTKSIRIGAYRDGKLVQLGHACGLSDAERDFFWRNQHLVGVIVVEVECSAVFASGLLRHPRFVRIRTDVLPSEVTA